ncbi:MAG: ankyrin repeat domain-containing protein [Simkaniaceae bacterium]|nr:ankyrin repeat domain-containing protein [Simkaniaceae bacterium]
MASDATSSVDICSMDRIYNSDYQYSVPRSLLEAFLSGKAFDHKESYTREEAAHLERDIQSIYNRIINDVPSYEKVAIITAGAPGAGKTTLLHRDREKLEANGVSYAYICPDDVCLKSQRRTYRRDLKESDHSKEARRAAYDKWRPGSNAATHLILGNLIREGIGFYYGTTSTSDKTHLFFNFLKKQGYHIRLIHLSATDDVRYKSNLKRDETFIQTTKEDEVEKGKLLPQRISDTFLKHADEIEFWVRQGVDDNAVLAATWKRIEPKPRIQIMDVEAYKEIKAIHDCAVGALGRTDLQWKNTVERDAIVELPINSNSGALLVRAARDGHVEIVREFVRAGAPVDQADGYGDTPLKFAAKNGYVEIVRELISAGAPVDQADRYGSTPLTFAAMNGHAEIVREFVRAGASVDQADGYGDTPLKFAAMNGHAEIVREFVRAGAPVDQADGYGDTPLKFAAMKGHAEIVRDLISAGAPVDQADRYGSTPLKFAAMNGHAEIVRELTSAEASVDHAETDTRSHINH